MRFQARQRRPRFEEDDNVLSMDNPGMSGNPEGGRIFLKRWKSRASSRRAKLARELLAGSLSPKRIQDLTIWLRNLESRKAWLEARLEHNVGIESIVRAAIERKPMNRE